MTEETPEFESYMDQNVVLDTRGELLYLGKLTKIYENMYELTDADVHDVVSGRTSKELYIMHARKHGIKKNRAKVLVRKVEVVSMSRLADVLEY